MGIKSALSLAVIGLLALGPLTLPISFADDEAGSTDPIAFGPRSVSGWEYGAGIHFDTGYFSGVMSDKSSGIDYLCAADGQNLALVTAPVTSGSMKAARQVDSLVVSAYTPKGSTSSSHTLSDGTALAQIAYVASTIGSPSNTEAAAREAAIARIAGVYEGSVWDRAAKGTFSAANTDALVAAATRSAELQAEAKQLAGPYSAGLKIVLDAGGQTGSLEGVGVVSAAGKWLSGRHYTLTLEGPAELIDASAGEGTTAATSIDGVRFRVTGTGEITAHIRVDGVPDSRPWVSEGTSNLGAAQNLVQVGRTAKWNGKSQPEPVVMTFQPVVSTHVKAEAIEAGEPLVDVVEASARGKWLAIPDSEVPVPVVVRIDVYGPFSVPREESTVAKVTEDERLGSYSVTFNGPGVKETDATILAPSEGFYMFRAVVDLKEQGTFAQFIRPFESPFFEASETNVVQWRPEIITSAVEVSIDEAVSGVRDELTVSGFPSDHGDFPGLGSWSGDHGVIDHYLYFIPEGTDHVEGVTAQIEPLAHVQTPARNGEYVIEPEEFPIDWDLGMGTYQVVSEFVGDSRVAAVRTSDIDPKEQVHPTFGEVRTVAFSETKDVKAGARIGDTVILTGNFPAGSYTEVDLFAWPVGSSPTCENPIWTAKRIEHGGNAGEYSTELFTTDKNKDLTYGFVERTYDAGGNPISIGTCGESSETLVIKVVHAEKLPRTGASMVGLALVVTSLLAGGTFLVRKPRQR